MKCVLCKTTRAATLPDRGQEQIYADVESAMMKPAEDSALFLFLQRFVLFGIHKMLLLMQLIQYVVT